MVLPGLLVKAVLVAASTSLIGAGAPPAAAPTPELTAAPSPTVSPGAPAQVVAPGAPAQPVAPCRPSEILDLTNWKITLPLPKPDGKRGALEIEQPELARFTDPAYFVPNATCDGVVFRAPVNGATTSGSKNPRSELREMTDRGEERAAWSSGAGHHRMTVVEAFTRLPEGKPQLVGAQIHGGDDDITVIRLEGTNLWMTEGDNNHHKLITDRYRLGTRFEVTYDVSGGEVRVFYNGELVSTLKDRFRGAYFKAGAYTQANCGNAQPCSADNFGETTVYSVTVSHEVTVWQEMWDLALTWAPWGLLGVAVLVVGYLVFRRLRPRRPRRRGAHARS